MKNDRIQEQPLRHDPAVDSGQLDPTTAQKKPFVEPILSPSVSLPDVTTGFFGPLS